MSYKDIFDTTQTIAVVGLSANPGKASNEVALSLSPHFKIIPVNPNYSEIMGLTCYPDLHSVPEHVDMVDIFQRSEHVMPYVQPAIDIGVRYFWMQLGIANPEARHLLETAGIVVIENKCTKIEYAASR